MVFAEVIGIEATRERVKFYATDVDEEALSEARGAVYSEGDLERVPEHLRATYFDRPAGGRGYSFRKDLRRSVIFGRNDLVQDAPISRIDLLVCRNVLMYLNSETQAKCCPASISRPARAVSCSSARPRCCSPTPSCSPRSTSNSECSRPAHPESATDAPHHLLALAQPGTTEAGRERVELGQEALNTSANAHIVVDADLALAFANARALQMFGMSTRDIGKPFRDLELSYSPVELRGLIDDVVANRHPVEVREIEWQRGTDEPVFLEVSVIPLLSDGSRYLGTSVTITDVTAERRLRDGYELATPQLETAYEELQSTNDELQSINDMLRDRTLELEQLRDFLDTVTGSLHAGLVSVDAKQRVQVWNRQAQEHGVCEPMKRWENDSSISTSGSR